jgi:hypothetical protein
VGLRAVLADAANTAPVLLLNNDAQIDEATLTALWRDLVADPHLGMVGPALYATENPQQLISAGGRDPALHMHTHMRHLPSQPISKVDYVSGSVALIRHNSVAEVGLLDEDYFFNTEIADWCQRARQRGFATAIDARVGAFHNLARSSALRDTLYTYYIVRNRLLYTRKFYATRKPWLLLFWMAYGLALAGRLRLGGKAATARAVWLGTQDALAGRFGDQNARIAAACEVSLP